MRSAWIAILVLNLLVQADRALAISCADLQSELATLTHDISCNEHSDCAMMQLPPPFGCNYVLNKKAVSDVEALLVGYEESCGKYLYNCKKHVRKLVCENHRCQAIGVRLDRTYPSNTTVDRNARPLK